MSTVIKNLLRLKKADIKSAAKVFSRAFFEDPLANFLFPEEKTRQQSLMDYFEFRIRYGILYGEVYSTKNLEGVAVWIAPKNVKMTQWKMLRAGGMKLYSKLGKEIINRMGLIEQYTSELHHKSAPIEHWHLTPIGVDTNQRGKGFASQLIRPMLQRCDEENVACFLETQSKTNVEIYKRYGFRVVEKGFIPAVNIDHWTMLRNPKKR